MRSLWVVLMLLPLAGCFGPYASDFDPEPPGPRQSAPVTAWSYEAGGTELFDLGNASLPKPFTRLTGFNGAEPNLGITASGTLFMTAMDDTIRWREGMRLWESVYSFEPSLGEGGTETGDPMLWVDTVTDRIYTNHMFPSLVCFATAWSEDDGESWDENESSCTIPGVDHQKFFTAVPGPLAPEMAGQDHPTVLYQCSQKVLPVERPEELPPEAPWAVPRSGVTTHCNMSYDGGQTWPAETVAAARIPAASCAGINGHPAGAPDGTVAVPITRGCDGLYVAVSLDSGLTWTNRPGPKVVGAESIDPDLTFTPDGTLYAMWRGADHLPYLARSSDVGLTWDGPWRVSPPGVTSSVFQVIGSGDDGRIAMAFLGSENTREEPSFAGENTTWNLYITTSEDAADGTPTLTTVQLTDDRDPVQRGCVWLYGGGNPCRNMLDFIDSAVHPDGTYYVAYTDGCTACIDDSQPARATAFAWLDGFSLYAGGE